VQFAILHRTVYRYAARVQSTVQTLRLTPRVEPHQRVIRWKLHAPGTLSEGHDAFGNTAHTLALYEPHEELAIDVRGEIEVDALREGRLDDQGGLPAAVFIAPTRLTQPDERVRDFAGQRLRQATATALLEFALAIRDTVAYETGSTHVGTSAAEALSLGRGVCQDHAHLFIAGCRARGIPARYVSGYHYTSDSPHAASHAWADACCLDLGWISIDITHGGFASDALARLAVGRDYDSASPMRGVRVGGGEESMEVRVNMRPIVLPAPDRRSGS